MKLRYAKLSIRTFKSAVVQVQTGRYIFKIKATMETKLQERRNYKAPSHKQYLLSDTCFQI
jgi:hypothetical protein